MTHRKIQKIMAITKKHISFFDGVKMVEIPRGTELIVDLANGIAEYNGMCFYIDENELVFFC